MKRYLVIAICFASLSAIAADTPQSVLDPLMGAVDGERAQCETALKAASPLLTKLTEAQNKDMASALGLLEKTEATPPVLPKSQEALALVVSKLLKASGEDIDSYLKKIQPTCLSAIRLHLVKTYLVKDSFLVSADKVRLAKMAAGYVKAVAGLPANIDSVDAAFQLSKALIDNGNFVLPAEKLAAFDVSLKKNIRLKRQIDARREVFQDDKGKARASWNWADEYSKATDPSAELKKAVGDIAFVESK